MTIKDKMFVIIGTRGSDILDEVPKIRSPALLSLLPIIVLEYRT